MSAPSLALSDHRLLQYCPSNMVFGIPTLVLNQIKGLTLTIAAADKQADAGLASDTTSPDIDATAAMPLSFWS